MWADAPAANIGVATGGGLLVVDADSESAEEAVRGLGVTNTTTVKTARGRHFYLRGPSRNRHGVLPGVDVRGDGGYVVGAGSLHPSGFEYRWETPPWELRPADAPPELLALLTPKKQASRELDMTGPIGEGRRNQTLHRIASTLRGLAGLNYPEILDALTTTNRLRCRPPLDDSEVERIARSAGGYDATPLWLCDPLGFAAEQRLHARERHLLAALVRYCNLEGACFPSIRRLCADTGMASDTIERTMDRLIAHGQLTRERRRGTSNLYRLLKIDESQSSGSIRAQPSGSSVLDVGTPAVRSSRRGAGPSGSRRA